MSKPTIERIEPRVSIEQITELVKAATASKTNEIELMVADCIKGYLMPPMIIGSKELRGEMSKPMQPGQLIVVKD